MREARDWFISEFFPEKFEDLQVILTPGNPHNAHFRMVVTYWDMAASFAVRGPLNPYLLLESVLVWAKVEPFIGQFREAMNLPEYLRNLEEIIEIVDWAPRRMAQRAIQDLPRPAWEGEADLIVEIESQAAGFNHQS